MTSRSERGRWEVVWVGDGEPLAVIAAGGLEAEGIPAQVVGNQAARFTRGLVTAFGSWAVLVPSSEALAARAVLVASGDGANVMESGSGGGAIALSNLRVSARLTLFSLPFLALVALVLILKQGS